MPAPVRILVVGLGTMGLSHARAYASNPGFALVGFCSRNIRARDDLEREFGDVPRIPDYMTALAELRPDAVSINTWPDTHLPLAMAALEAGCHVFIEKPLAETVEDARAIADLAQARDKKLVVGYILRVHPSWMRFVELGRTLGKPLVMRLNLNQQSSGATWGIHKALMRSLSPIVDCGVHYVDVMCQVTGAKPVKVHAVGARLTDEIDAAMYNYGQLQVTFDDGSVGWYEAGWGPMMSETAFFVKDLVGPKGSVSIVMAEREGASAAIDSHTRTSTLRLHHSALRPVGGFARADEILTMADEPDHQALCDREQALFLDAMRHDRDLSSHVEDAIQSLRIVLAADQSVRTGEVVRL